MTKKKLEEFDKAQTVEYLSDDGEGAAKFLLNVIMRANAAAKYPHKKQQLGKSSKK